MRNFCTQWFGAVSNNGYHNTKTGLRTYFLSFGEGAQLEIMNQPNLTQTNSHTAHYGYAHLAFQVDGRERVDILAKGLMNAGYSVVRGPRVTGDGYYESCILGPEGNRIEIAG